VTTTDEILALAATAADDMAAGPAIAVTEANIAAFRAAAARGADSTAVRALLTVRQATALTITPDLPKQPAGPSSSPLSTACVTSPAAAPPGDPAWTAWLTAAAAAAGEPRPVWCAVFGTAVALTDPPASAPPAVAVTGAIAAGLAAAAIVESGLADWEGWSSGTVAAAIGAGVTAGLLLCLTEPQLRAAIGICATQAAGLRAAAGTDAFPLQVGKAAFNGVEAALLARAGLTAPAEPLDGRRGLFALFGAQQASAATTASHAATTHRKLASTMSEQARF
jgi:hypothetical protein